MLIGHSAPSSYPSGRATPANSCLQEIVLEGREIVFAGREGFMGPRAPFA